MTDMINVVSFSGGRTSAYLVYVMQNLYKKGEITKPHFVFMDTGAEHPKTYEFIKKVVAYLNIELVCLRTKISPELGKGVRYQIINLQDARQDLKPFQEMTEKYGTPSVGMSFCTRVMKTDPCSWYLRDMFGKDNYVTWLGIRADEPRRLTKRKNIRYLAEISDFDKKDINDWWQEQPFDLDLPEHLGNCVFCIKKGVNKIALAARDEPKMADDFENLLASDRVRVLENRQAKGISNEAAYRNWMTLPQIRKTYEEIPTDQILTTSLKNVDTCTESCEAFNCTQYDLL